MQETNKEFTFEMLIGQEPSAGVKYKPGHSTVEVSDNTDIDAGARIFWLSWKLHSWRWPLNIFHSIKTVGVSIDLSNSTKEMSYNL